MKHYLVIAALVAAGAGAVEISAGTTVNLKGSDTLFEFTNAMIAGCPGTVGPYAGTGSSNGQSAMLAGTQQIAPMSRFLNNGACVAATQAKSEGLVVGLDSIVVVASTRTFGSVACNGDLNTQCDPTFEPATGTAYNTTVAGYTFTGWRDVLRVLLAGFDHDNIGTAAANWAARDCNSAVRVALANNYGALFENNCSASAGESGSDVNFNPTCQRIRHIFRRDDFSGTTDTVIGLLGLPSIVSPDTSVTLNTNGTPTTIVQHTGANPFCNSVRPSFVFPVPQPVCLQGADATWDPTDADVPAGCTRENSVYRATMQDNDPIRRPCPNSGENICSHSKDLGLVLPMNDVPENAPRTNADRYNATPCAVGRFTSTTPPQIYDAVTQALQTCSRGALCPNGDICNTTGACLVPSTTTGSAQCLAGVTNAPLATSSVRPVPVIHPLGPGVAEGRAYNQHLYVQVGTSGAYQTSGFIASPPMTVTGAYYRLHTTRSLDPAVAPAAPVTCQFPDMTDQIGCLVKASPCSIGYAGRGALNTNANTVGLKINKQSPELLCVQGHFLYPLSRKLYVNSTPGFAAVTGQELQLAGCMTDFAQTNLTPPTPAGLVTTNIVTSGFIPLPPFINNAEPFCEDFNEAALCGAAVNVNACGVPKPNFDIFPEFNTICGDGQVDSFEDCDNGTVNGPPPATCATTCRFNN